MFSKSYAYLVCGMLVCATIIPSVSFAYDLQSIEKLADQGQAKAQYEWGMRLMDGDKVKQDTIRGRRWIEKAAKQGYRDAQT